MRQDDSTVRKAEMAREALVAIINQRVCRFVGDYAEDREELIDAILATLESSPADGDGRAVRAAAIEECALAFDAHERLLRAIRKAVEPLVLFHESGGHEGDGSEERIALVRKALTPTETGEVGADGH